MCWQAGAVAGATSHPRAGAVSGSAPWSICFFVLAHGLEIAQIKTLRHCLCPLALHFKTVLSSLLAIYEPYFHYILITKTLKQLSLHSLSLI